MNFNFLKKEKGFEGFPNGIMKIPMELMLSKIDKNWKNTPDIKWNFTKFLVDREGNVVKRYDPTFNPKDIEKDLLELL